MSKQEPGKYANDSESRHHGNRLTGENLHTKNIARETRKNNDSVTNNPENSDPKNESHEDDSRYSAVNNRGGNKNSLTNQDHERIENNK